MHLRPLQKHFNFKHNKLHKRIHVTASPQDHISTIRKMLPSSTPQTTTKEPATSSQASNSQLYTRSHSAYPNTYSNPYTNTQIHSFNHP
ncbi:hypothetical protein EYC80_004299 [Monilinia laxa]|uniref:Uncharacterized protein n=1 Tax=Monilinia laxa TaxID=61186 RepID=A0A5N6KMC6_MONLA|nr:hypothetical protein EYC80_004299 [Monilinia laxa]